MSQRNTSPLKRSTVRRTLQRFWDVTRTQPLIVFLSVFSSAGYIFLLTFANTYVMALIVDRVQAGPVAGDQVFEVFGPYILALVLVNLVGQILSKLQDYTVYKLEIAGNYHLARLCFDTLSNQSMTFHTSRFGGSLVSQTSRFMSGYTGLVDVTVYSLIPTITSVICTVAALAPVVPTFTVILVCIMVVYIAFVWLMYKRIMPLSARRPPRRTSSRACSPTRSRTSWPSRPAGARTLNAICSTPPIVPRATRRRSRCTP